MLGTVRAERLQSSGLWVARCSRHLSARSHLLRASLGQRALASAAYLAKADEREANVVGAVGRARREEPHLGAVQPRRLHLRLGRDVAILVEDEEKPLIKN